MSFLSNKDPHILNPHDFSNNVVDEKTTRRKFINHARRYGCEKELLIILAKYDKLMKLSNNVQEQADISKLGCMEVFKLLDSYGQLYVNNQLVLERK